MRRSRIGLLLTLAVFLPTACSEVAAPAHTPVNPDDSNPYLGEGPRGFIVVLEPKADPLQVAREHDIQPRFVYRNAFNGFAGHLSDLARTGALRDSRIVRLEVDRPVQVEEAVQLGATWGLDRVDQRSTALDTRYAYSASGKGVTAYIVDSGIRFSHFEFNGRASAGFDVLGGDASDCSGHGTHVAGTVGGGSFGIAKEVKLVSVRVLDCNSGGNASAVLAGLEWILLQGRRPAVVNLSVTVSGSSLVDDAVRRLHQAGFTVVAAAGNSNMDACRVSPARAPEAITVGATTSTDARASYSNYGSCLDWFAPGSSIVSAGITSDDATSSKSGTSMAAPHTTGAVALYLEQNSAADGQQVAAELGSWLTRGAVSAANSRNNHLLYTRGEVSAGPGNAAPVAGFTAACTRLDCVFADRSTDSDGTITSARWDFGDGTSESQPAYASPAHHFAAGGVYRVSLNVTDDAGGTSTWASDVAVGVVLNTLGSKQRGKTAVELIWKGATSATVDIYLDGQVIATTANNGGYTFHPSQRGQHTYSFRVCEVSSTPMCSRDQAITL